MIRNLSHNLPPNLKRNIMPWHPRQPPILYIILKILHLNKILNPNIIIINPWIHISPILINRMIYIIISTKTKIETSHICYFLIYDDCFFVMAPQMGDQVVWVHLDLDVWVLAYEGGLGVLGVVGDDGWGVEDQDVYFYSAFSFSFQKFIQSPTIRILTMNRPNQINFRRKPPPTDHYISFSILNLVSNLFKICFSINNVINTIFNTPWDGPLISDFLSYLFFGFGNIEEKCYELSGVSCFQIHSSLSCV